MLSSRSLFLLGFLFCTSMLAIAGYFQFIEHLEPCPLCILQRIFTLFVGLIMLVAVLHNPKQLGIRLYSILISIIALVGAGISARHVWLQHLPEDQVPTCGPGFNFILDNYPLGDAVNMVMRGSGECAEVVWSFLGLSIPAWTFVAFICLALLSLTQLFRKQNIR